MTIMPIDVKSIGHSHGKVYSVHHQSRLTSPTILCHSFVLSYLLTYCISILPSPTKEAQGGSQHFSSENRQRFMDFSN